MAKTSLPDEIWSDIFSAVTDVPGPLDTIRDPFAHPPPSIDIGGDLLRTYSTNYSLSLVDKQFNRVVSPLLYKHIIIRDKKRREGLKRTLRHGLSSTHDIFQHTQRLELPFAFSRDGNAADEELMRGWIRSLRNLRIFVLSMGSVGDGQTWEPFPSDLDSILNVLPSSVKAIEIEYDSGCESISVLARHNLDTVTIRPFYRPRRHARLNAQINISSALYDVKSLDIPFKFLKAVCAGGVPTSLCRIALSGRAQYQDVVVLASIGHQLVHLEVPDTFHRAGKAEDPSSTIAMDTFESAFPRLQTLVINVEHRVEHLDRFNILPRSVEKLGIRFPENFTLDRKWRDATIWDVLFSSIACLVMQNGLTRLAVVRFIGSWCSESLKWPSARGRALHRAEQFIAATGLVPELNGNAFPRESIGGE